MNKYAKRNAALMTGTHQCRNVVAEIYPLETRYIILHFTSFVNGVSPLTALLCL